MTSKSKTDAELLAEAEALDEAYARAEAFDRDDAEALDAYGHMNWTVGNEDWVACFDAIRVAEGIAYHVVIDCDSGGFIDTIEQAVVALGEIDTLRDLPWRYADSAVENDVSVTPEEVEEVVKCWGEHLDGLVAQSAPEPEDGEASGEAEWYAELNRGYERDRI